MQVISSHARPVITSRPLPLRSIALKTGAVDAGRFRSYFLGLIDGNTRPKPARKRDCKGATHARDVVSLPPANRVRGSDERHRGHHVKSENRKTPPRTDHGGDNLGNTPILDANDGGVDTKG